MVCRWNCRSKEKRTRVVVFATTEPSRRNESSVYRVVKLSLLLKSRDQVSFISMFGRETSFLVIQKRKTTMLTYDNRPWNILHRYDITFQWHERRHVEIDTVKPRFCAGINHNVILCCLFGDYCSTIDEFIVSSVVIFTRSVIKIVSISAASAKPDNFNRKIIITKIDIEPIAKAGFILDRMWPPSQNPNKGIVTTIEVKSWGFVCGRKIKTRTSLSVILRTIITDRSSMRVINQALTERIPFRWRSLRSLFIEGHAISIVRRWIDVWLSSVTD